MSLELRNLRDSVDLGGGRDTYSRNHVPKPDSPPSHSLLKPDEEKLLQHHPRIQYGRQRLKKREPYLEKNIFVSFLSFSWLIHVIAIGCTIAAVRLSFGNTYWVDEKEWDTRFLWSFLRGRRITDIIQFAAKLYEIIIVCSLAAMAVHVVRRKLLGDGVPWGLMSGAYQVGAPPYLFSLDLWMPIFRPRTMGNFLMAVGLALFTVYANMIGPFTAIVLMPTLEWWPVDNPYGGEKLTSFLTYSTDDVYPQILGEEIAAQLLVGDYTCEEFAAQYCPDSGMPDVKELLEGYSKSSAKPSVEIKQIGAETSRELTSSLRYSSENGHMAIATTLHASVAELVGEFWHYVDSEEVGFVNKIGRPKFSPTADDVYAPIVQVQCSQFSYNRIKDSDDRPKFHSGRMRSFSTYFHDGETDWYTEREQWDVPDGLQGYWDPERDNVNDYTFDWVNAADLSDDDGASIAAFITVPTIYNISDAGDEIEPEEDSLLLPCMIDARWAGVDMSYDPTSESLLSSNLTDFGALEDYWLDNGKTPGGLYRPRLQISLEWANFLNLKVTEDEDSLRTMPYLLQSFNRRVYDKNNEPTDFLSFRTANYSSDLSRDQLDKEAARAVATALSLAVTEALSRVSLISDLGVVLREIDQDTIEWKGLHEHAGKEPQREDRAAVSIGVPIDWEVERKGWGYGFKTDSIKVGVAMCLLHSLLVVLYAAYNLWFRLKPGGWASGAFSSFGELIAMGLKSRMPGDHQLVGDLASGSNKRRTLTTNVVVRETGEDRVVELLIGEDDHKGKPLARATTYG